MISKAKSKKLDKRMYVYLDCPAALFPKLTAFIQMFASKEHTIMAVVGSLKPFDEKIQRSIRSSINETCKTTDATQDDWLEAIGRWQQKTGNSHNMQVVQFVKREAGCEVG
jgi:hypothetical protein